MRRRWRVRTTERRGVLCRRCGLEAVVAGEVWGPACIAAQERRLVDRVRRGYTPEEILGDEGEGLEPREL